MDRQPLTRTQKRALAVRLLHQAGNLVEFWGEYVEDDEILSEVNSTDAAAQLSRWLKHLPGEYWDLRLPDPTDV